MGGGDDARLMIRKEHRAAIGGKCTKGNAGNIRYHGVGFRARVAERFGDVDDVGE